MRLTMRLRGCCFRHYFVLALILVIPFILRFSPQTSSMRLPVNHVWVCTSGMMPLTSHHAKDWATPLVFLVHA